MSTILKSSGKIILGSISAIAILVGGYLFIVGVINGFGNDSLPSRLTVSGSGLAAAVIGFYLLYIASNKNIVQAIGNILDGIVTILLGS